MPVTSETKHLDGPWRSCQNGDCSCGMVWSIPGDFPVCTVANETGRNLQVVAVVHEHMADAPDMIYQTLDRDVVLANARLIAAAPDMLEKLKKVHQWLLRLESQSLQQAKDGRFQSLSEACAADAKNYRKTADDIEAVIAKAMTDTRA